MRVPDADALLEVWERYHAAHPIRRAVALLEAACPAIGAKAWEEAPVGQRDCCLLGLHEALFGGELATTTECPRCNQRLESTFAARDVRVRALAEPLATPSRRLRAGGFEVAYRLPTSRDLLAIAAAKASSDAAAGDLLSRCVLSVRLGDRAIDPLSLPAEVVQSLTDRMAKEDPEAEIVLELTCPACAHGWRKGFDIVRHILGDLEDWAHRLLVEIHTIAGAYGWSESEILSLSPTRRRLYLDMVQA